MLKIFPLLFLPFLLACADDQQAATPSTIMVEGYIEHDGYPVVMLTKTMSMASAEHNVEHLADYVVKWAKVSVVHRSDTVVLTGKYERGYFPPYIYTTTKMKGQAGETYKLIVEYEGRTAHATTTIPRPPEGITYQLEKVNTKGTFFQIKATLPPSTSQTDYYQFFTKTGTRSKQFIASFMGTIALPPTPQPSASRALTWPLPTHGAERSDQQLNDEKRQFPIYRGHQLGERDYTPYFLFFEAVAIKCCRLQREGYDFWRTYQEAQYLSGAAMLSPSNNLPSNIIGGTGYWLGYGSTTAYFIINYDAY